MVVMDLQISAAEMREIQDKDKTQTSSSSHPSRVLRRRSSGAGAIPVVFTLVPDPAGSRAIRPLMPDQRNPCDKLSVWKSHC
jgi:hypothetical protein